MSFSSIERAGASGPLRVLVDHHFPVISAGLAATLAREGAFDVEAPSRSLEPSVGDRYDVIVADRQRALDWVDRSRRRMRFEPRRHPRILVMDDSDGEAQVRAALDAGVHGYVLTDCGLRELVEGIGLLGRGGRYLCPTVASRMADSLTRTALTPRESAVLRLMVAGCSNKVIAREMGIAVGTVKTHAKSLFGKLGVRTRNQAVALANERGLVAELAA